MYFFTIVIGCAKSAIFDLVVNTFLLFSLKAVRSLETEIRHFFSFVGVSLDQWKKTYLTTFGFFSWWNFSLIKFLKRKFVQWNLKSKYFHFREFTLMLKLFSDLGSFAAHEWIKWGGTLLCLRVSPKLSRGTILWWLWKNLVSFSSRFKINEII